MIASNISRLRAYLFRAREDLPITQGPPQTTPNIYSSEERENEKKPLRNVVTSTRPFIFHCLPTKYLTTSRLGLGPIHFPTIERVMMGILLSITWFGLEIEKL